MKTFVDGDQLVIVNDDFKDLQASEAVFIPLVGREIDDIVSAWFLANDGMVEHIGYSNDVKIVVTHEEAPHS